MALDPPVLRHCLGLVSAAASYVAGRMGPTWPRRTGRRCGIINGLSGGTCCWVNVLSLPEKICACGGREVGTDGVEEDVRDVNRVVGGWLL